MVPDSDLDYSEYKAKRYDNVIHEYMNFELINENALKLFLILPLFNLQKF